MKLSLENRTNLIKLSERASNLLVEMIDEDIPSAERSTKREEEFEHVLSQMYKICPLLSNSYAKMYNQLQEEKASPDKSYIGCLRKK